MRMGPADTVQESCWERLGENQQRDLLPCSYGCVQCAVSLKCHSNQQVGVEMGARVGDFGLMNGAETQVSGHMKPRLRETVTRATGAEDEAGVQRWALSDCVE